MRLVPPAAVAVAVAALVAGPRGAVADDCPISNQPNMLKLADGSPQTAQLGKPFQTNLQVALANSNGCPVTGSLAGTPVTFVAPSGGASGTFASSGTNAVTVGTNAEGLAAAPSFTANDVAGGFGVSAHSSYGTVELSLTNTASGVPATITATGPSAQAATINRTYGRPLRAHVLDADGRPVPGVSVTFSLPSAASGAGASFVGGGSQATATTDANGQASSPPLQANGIAGRFTAAAGVTEIAKPARYPLTNLAGKPAAIKVGAANDQATRPGSRFPIPLAVTVTDASKNPVAGALVTFTAPAHGPSGHFATGRPGRRARAARIVRARTNAQGVAVAPAFTANAKAGGYVVTATVAGGTRRTAFALVNGTAR
jgi:adhesin/invasin